MALAHSHLHVFCCFRCALCDSPKASLFLVGRGKRLGLAAASSGLHASAASVAFSFHVIAALVLGGLRLLTAPPLLVNPAWMEVMEVRASITRVRASRTQTSEGPHLFCARGMPCRAAVDTTLVCPSLLSTSLSLCACVCTQSHQVTRPRCTVSLRAPRRR